MAVVWGTVVQSNAGKGRCACIAMVYPQTLIKYPAMSDDDCDLEALLDVLDEDESEEGQAEVDGEQNKSWPLQGNSQ